ncbi:hypothetical protein M501DRAFT_1031664 [Patellaria atrata CBS 101060]|uniref:Transcription initiation factor TFIID subunit 1 histone acetyltransferase domain-containing protein n=1 Tax=Patellaria atrata CBS 101060 TaxID=1346257 RepID=A0A9P4S9L8_9PEZI|nr:hypothetical protein M501DRAFT_1031664 [Patellaria atrata CBS 101060]
MPHAVENMDSPRPQDEPEQDDDTLIQNLLNADITGEDGGTAVFGRDLEIGEKDAGAIDYMDISDDDLPEEEDVDMSDDDGANGNKASGGTFSDLQDDAVEDDRLDDLFGDDEDDAPPPAFEEQEAPNVLQPSSGNLQLPPITRLSLPGEKPSPVEKITLPSVRTASPTPEVTNSVPVRDVEKGWTSKDLEDWDEQTRLFQTARSNMERRDRGEVVELPQAPETDAEVFAALWPQFEKDKRVNLHRLLPGKRAFYIPRTPFKPPRPIQPTKIDLELQQEQDKLFTKLSAPVALNKRKRQHGQSGIVVISEDESGSKSSEEEMEIDIDNDEEKVHGFTFRDLQIICADWDIDAIETKGNEDIIQLNDIHTDRLGNEYWNTDVPPLKKRKAFDGIGTPFPISIYPDEWPSFDDPEETTAQLARKVRLDLNDPYLLLDEQQPNTVQSQSKKAVGDFKKDATKGISKSLLKRFNISNDDAYDALKENHQHKVRSTLGSLSVEHSLPAIKLQYPFYKVQLNPREARSFHRPAFNFGQNERITFNKLGQMKKKERKGKSTQDLFAKAKDLTLADNSSAVLFEYSEEYPTMLSNFGMGNRLIHYYRRKDPNDNYRPKPDFGEGQVLLPQDKSPFSIFGKVESGETVPTLQNGMYRAPVFSHNVKSTDFLVGKSVTGVHGTSWYLRNIDQMYVVGQEFPSTEVPGIHSRKTTEAQKKRLKMLSYRMYRKNQRDNKRGALLSNEMIKSHILGSDISSNRGKMREFMNYDKETSSWVPRRGDVIPDEDTMRTWIKPEDICLLDSMQVGERQLADAGYNRAADEMGDEDEEEKEGESLDQQLAPWNTTKNFLNACQSKAMLQLHGEGDPSGRGEAFSFIKTSMKGGFKAIGESVEDKLDAKRLKELGGHSYNVAKQQKAYEEAIDKIWDAQKQSLVSTVEHEDVEPDVDEQEAAPQPPLGQTPRSELGNPFAHHRRDDDASQMSRYSTSSQSKGKVLKITRTIINKYGKEEVVEEVVQDQNVIREYIKRRRAIEIQNIDIDKMQPTGNAAVDEKLKKHLEGELQRLSRNKDRRMVREKAKATMGLAASPGDAGSPGAGPSKGAGGTQRKCAACGRAGHIKTNKKYAGTTSLFQ